MSSNPKIDTSDFMALPITSVSKLEEDRDSMRTQMELMILERQAEICKKLESVEKHKTFKVERWTKTPGDRGGVGCVLQGGTVLEKAGVMVSVLKGEMPVAMTKVLSTAGHLRSFVSEGKVGFYFAALTLAIHPVNPHAPSYQSALRYCELTDSDGSVQWWFAGNSDLIPGVLHENDVCEYHTKWKSTCDKLGPDSYEKFKQLCDKYFFIVHRGETRGVGGIVFDDLNDDFGSKQQLYDFVKDCSSTFVTSYIPILERHVDDGFTEEEKRWQYLRRGRFIEFNLVYDKGTTPWLPNPGSNAETILVSLPPTAGWDYKPELTEGQQRHVDILRNPIEWVK